MKNLKIFCALLAAGWLATPMRAQTFTPFQKSTVNYPTSPGAENYCDDYSIDFASGSVTTVYSSSTENGMVSIDTGGTINTVLIEPGAANLHYGPFHRLGNKSCVMVIDNEALVLRLSFRDNISCSETEGYDANIPAGFNQVEVLGFVFHTLSPEHFIITTLLKAFDTGDGKWKVLVLRSDVNNLGDTATHEFYSFIVGSFAAIPADIAIDPTGNVYVWGYYNKNAAGINHDLFLTKFNSAGIFQYTKMFASYTGRDDIASRVVFDNAGNLYAISLSEDNVAPYSDHAAIFKIKTSNGKALWTKRIGEGTAGDEHFWDVAGNPSGDGLVLTGSYVTPSGGRDGRTWRMNAAGTTLWMKTINQNPAVATVEECRTVCFDAITGDVLVAGFASNNAYIERYNTTTGVAPWPVKLYEGPESGFVLNDKMILQSALTGDDWLLFPSENPGGVCCRSTMSVFAEHVMKTGIEIESEMAVYPNPTSQQIQIAAVGLLQIFDGAGRLVSEQLLSDEVTTLETSTWQNGCYTARVINNNVVSTRTFVIIH